MNSSFIPKRHLSLYNSLSNLLQFSSDSWLFSTSTFFSKVGAHEANIKFDKGSRPVWYFKIAQIFKYYLLIFLNFFNCVLFKFSHIVSRQRIDLTNQVNVLIDSYVVVNNILNGQEILSDYFPNLIPVLEEKNLRYIILPRIYGSKSPVESYKLFKYWQKTRERVLTEYQLLTFFDFIVIFFAAVIYPFVMFGIMWRLKRIGLFDSRLEFYFWSDLNGSNLIGSIRYIFSKKLVSKLGDDLKLIQWYEGQTYEKCLNRALRESGKQVTIYGCQLFIFPPELLNVYIDKNEIKAHLPNVILVNGSYYLESNPTFEIGPALRYSRLFEKGIQKVNSDEYLVLLSYFENVNEFVIKLIGKILNKNQLRKLTIKLHPSSDFTFITKVLNENGLGNVNIVKNNLYDLFEKFGFVIGSSSGSLVEAIAFGIPVIIVSEYNNIEFNYLPEFCRGILWDLAYDEISFFNVKNRLIAVKERSPNLRESAIFRVRNELFSKPSKSHIIKSFDLN